MKAARFKFQIVLTFVLCALQNPVSAQAPLWEWARSATNTSGAPGTHVQAINGGCFWSVGGNPTFQSNDTLSSNFYMVFVNSLGELRMGVSMSEPRQLSDIGNGQIGFASEINGSFVVGGSIHTSELGIGLITGKMDTTGTASDVLSMPNLIIGYEGHHILDVHQGTSGNLYVLSSFLDSVAIADTVLFGQGVYVARFTQTGDLIRADHFEMYPYFELGAIVEGTDGTLYVAIQNDDYQPNGLTLGMVLLFIGADGSIGMVYDDQNTSFYQQNPPRLSVDPNGGVFLAYSKYVGSDGGGINVLRFNHSGELVWENTMIMRASPTKIEATEDGGVLVSGYSIAPIPWPGLEYMGAGPNCVVYEISEVNEVLWAIADNTGNVYGATASMNSANEVYAAGYFEISARFGTHTLPYDNSPFSSYIARIGYGWLGVNEHGSIPLNIHPNPAHDRLWVSLPKTATETVQLIDLQGRVLRAEPTRGGQIELDVRGISPGAYVVRSGSSLRQLVIE